MSEDFIDPRFDYLGFLLGRHAAAVREATALALAPLSLNPREFGTLLLVASGVLGSQAQLGQYMGMDRTTTMTLVDRLEAEGWLRRDTNPAHRKRNALVITALGRGLLVRARTAAKAAEQRLFRASGLNATQSRELCDLLRRLRSDATDDLA